MVYKKIWHNISLVLQMFGEGPRADSHSTLVIDKNPFKKGNYAHQKSLEL